jgi:hypothetical protein
VRRNSKVFLTNGRPQRLSLLVLSVSLLAGCGSEAPFGVDPSLRESANRYAIALTQGDRASLAQLGTPGTQVRLDAIVGTYGGHTTTPRSYTSEDRGHAGVEFDVACGPETVTLVQVFLYQSGEWRPLFDAVESSTRFPAATVSAAPPPTPAPEPTCD